MLDFPEQVSRHCQLGQLECDVPALADNFGPDLQQFLLQRGQRPVFHFHWQRQRPHEVGEIIGQGVKLEPDGVVAELSARQPRPPHGVLAFLDILLRFTPLIVESNHPLGGARQVGDDDDQPDLSGPPFMRESGVVASPYVVAGV